MDVIRAESLTKVYSGGQYGLRDLSITIGQGEFVGVLGQSGAGKSTLFRLITGAIRPSSGSLHVLDSSMGMIRKSELRRLRRRLAVVYQQNNLVPTMTVIRNVLLGLLGNYSLPSTLRLLTFLRPDEQQLAYDALKQLGIEGKLYRRTDELSGGEQQRVAVARVLISKPELLLADEPISSVDERTAAVVMDALQQVNREYGTTVLLNLHQVGFAMRYCSRLLVLAGGRLIYDGSPEGAKDLDLYGTGGERHGSPS